MTQPDSLYLMLDTSTPACRLWLYQDDTPHHASWQAGRDLSRGLLQFMADTLAQHGYDWRDVTGLGVYTGPGSYTGLRIGITVLNTYADANRLPIVGATGDDWRVVCRTRLGRGETDQLVMPHYGGEAHVTQPKK